MVYKTKLQKEINQYWYQTVRLPSMILNLYYSAMTNAFKKIVIIFVLNVDRFAVLLLLKFDEKNQGQQWYKIIIRIYNTNHNLSERNTPLPPPHRN